MINSWIITLFQLHRLYSMTVNDDLGTKFEVMLSVLRYCPKFCPDRLKKTIINLNQD
jgi:hypothetical protein